MADNFTPMGAVPSFYAGLLNNAAQNLVRMPDGSYRAAPRMGDMTSIGQVYAGMYDHPPVSAPARLTKADPVGDLFASGGWNQFDDQFNDKPIAVAALQKAPGHLGTRGSVGGGASASSEPLGYTQDRLPKEGRDAPAIAAIAAATKTPSGAPVPRNRPIDPGQWEPATPSGTYDGGDPWAGSRIGSPPAGKTGMTTGRAPIASAPRAVQPSRPVSAPVQQRQSVSTPAPAPVAASGGGSGGGGGNGGGGGGETFAGSSTGRTYNVGQNYTTNSYGEQHTYQAQSDGSFKRVA